MPLMQRSLLLFLFFSLGLGLLVWDKWPSIYKHQTQPGSARDVEDGPAPQRKSRDLYLSGAIEDYRPIFERCMEAGMSRNGALLAIRRFTSGDHEYLLIVDPQSFQTSLVDAAGYICQPASPEEFADTPFI